MPLALQPGWPDGDDPRTSRWLGLDSIRSPRGGPLGGRPWKRRCRGSRGKPNPGFPPLPPPLGNRPWRFQLSHRLDDDSPSLSQTKGEEGSMTQADISSAIKSGQIQKLSTRRLQRKLRLVAPDFDIVFVLSGLRQIVGCLQSQPV